MSILLLTLSKSVKYRTTKPKTFTFSFGFYVFFVSTNFLGMTPFYQQRALYRRTEGRGHDVVIIITICSSLKNNALYYFEETQVLMFIRPDQNTKQWFFFTQTFFMIIVCNSHEFIIYSQIKIKLKPGPGSNRCVILIFLILQCFRNKYFQSKYTLLSPYTRIL